MKNNQKLILLVLIWISTLPLQGQSNPDTVVVNFGNSSKIIFYINEKGDLSTLESYDLNAIVTDMSEKIKADSSASSQDDSNKYLKDSLNTATSSDTAAMKENSASENERNEEQETTWNDDDDDDNDWDDRWRDSNHSLTIKKKVGTNHYINFDLGINNYLEDSNTTNSSAPYTVRPWGSWYFAINSVHKSHITGKLSLEWGAGISWYNFKFEDASTRLNKTETELQFVEGAGDGFKKSKLTASFINLSLVPVLNFGPHRRSDFRIGAGGYAGYRLGSHTKYIYKEDGKRQKDKDRGNFYLNNLRYGVRLQLGYKGTDFFINYDINELFNEGKAPKLNAFSFGITF